MLRRRDFLQLTGAGLVAGTALGGCGRDSEQEQSASTDATAAASVLGRLRGVAERLAEALAPGAAAAGFADYLESQLAGSAEDCLLMIRYLGVPPAYRDFYLPALAAIEQWSTAQFGASVESLLPQQLAQLVQDLAANKPGEWAAAPAAFVYFVLRSDAADAAYGTRAGFQRLGIPYMAHIEPTRDW